MTPPTWTHEKAEALKRTIELCSYPTFPIDCEIIRDALAEIDRLTAQLREAEARWKDITKRLQSAVAADNLDLAADIATEMERALPPPPAREGSEG